MAVPNVRRIDTGRTHGWQVHIMRDGEQTTKLFSDKKYGGSEKALEKAKARRDEMLEGMPDLPEPPGHLHSNATRYKAWKSLTRTGVKGISLNWVPVSDGVVPQICAMWADSETGKRKRRARSVRKHGLDHALAVCCEKLYEGRGEVGPDPDEIYAQAHPVIEELIEARRQEEEARKEARRRADRAREQALGDEA